LALAHSLASENQARLQTMQAAEKNLDEMRAGLQERLQSRRQNAVTEELLDVIAGFEILNQEAS
jgi:F-type H+-transporting ATPase subunit gamma